MSVVCRKALSRKEMWFDFLVDVLESTKRDGLGCRQQGAQLA